MNVSRLFSMLGAAVSISALAACSSASAPVVSGTESLSHASAVTANSVPVAAQIFVSAGRYPHGGIANEVDVYQKDAPHTLIRTITNGISGANGMTMDSSGNLYVSNVGNATIAKYAPGASTPSTIYKKDLTNPLTLAMGADGTLYAVNYNAMGQGSSIFEYAPGQTVPSFKIALSGGAEGLALDSNNNLYVGYNSSTFSGVLEFKPHSKTYVDLGIRLGFAGCVLFDNRGNLLACDQIAPSINVYKPGTTTPFLKISTPGWVNPYLAAFGKHFARLYVADSASTTFDIFEYPSGKPAAPLQRPTTAYGVAVTPGAF